MSQLRIRHATMMSELDESQSRELEQFRKTIDLEGQLQGAETRGKVDFLSFVCHGEQGRRCSVVE